MRATILAFVAFLIIAGVATGATADKGRRIAGPICVNLSTGVVRAVAEKPFQACRSGEIRRYGLYVKSSVTKKTIIIKGKAGPRGAAGTDGATGPAGAAGTAGPAGPQGGGGPQGPAGKVTVTQLTGDKANCVQISGSDGSSGVICGTAGAKGDPGPPGPPGKDGQCNCCPIPPPPPCPKNGKCKEA